MKKSQSKGKVLLGMSGGVDSSVSAVLLLEQGYEVIGAFMKNWSDHEDACGNVALDSEGKKSECSWREDQRDAMRVAAQLGIEFYTFDYEEEYRKDVYEYMIAEYAKGRTPNPDVMCNTFMKFGYLLEEADALSCDFIATGHYARVSRDAKGVAHLLYGIDSNKDQSYFLCRLDQHQMRRVLFPVGDLKKSEVRAIAKEHGLPVAEKKDSQGICFIGKVRMRDFLHTRIPQRPGNIVTTGGEKIGMHNGFASFTIGQRTGLGMGGGTPYFVVELRPDRNEVVVARGDRDPALFASALIASDVHEVVPGARKHLCENTVKARIRYRQPLQDCSVEEGETQGEILVRFAEHQRAVAPGQFVVFYDGEELLASAVIERAIHHETHSI